MRRTLMVCGATFAIVLAALVSFLIASDEVRGQATVSVDVGDMYFCDSSFANGICETNIAAGDTVTWNWVGSLSHTVTQCDPTFTTCPPPGGFNSGTLTGSGSTFSQTFNTAGTFPYQCNVHGASMRGRVIVAAAQQATPTATAGVTAPAQTATAGPTVSAPGATAAPTTAVPAAVPGTGGDEAGGGVPRRLLLLLAGGALLISAGAGVAVLRRR